MKVIKAQFAGACYGVQRAINLANKTVEAASSVETLGPLIHNPQVVKELEGKGIGVASSLDESDAETLIIRSHGVVPSVYEQAHDRGINLVDATCPHVVRAQKAAAMLARENDVLIVLGEAGHPEVEGLKAFALRENPCVYVLTSPEELPSNLPEKVGIVVQTTQARKRLEALVSALEKRGITPSIKDTICSATSKRQDAAAALADQVDAFVVIGGKNSSNTTRLYEICSSLCSFVVHVEDVSELKQFDFSPYKAVGLTAGASTPENQIEEVCAYLESL